MLFDSGLLVIADSHETCLYQEAELTDPIFSNFTDACIEKEVSCIDEKKLALGMNESEADEACSRFPLSIDPRYMGACPGVLEELESARYDGPSSLPARAFIRKKFYLDGIVNFDTSYRFRETKTELEMALQKDPSNILLLTSQFYYLDIDMEPVETIDLEINLRELDPDCKYNIPFMESTISHQLGFLISTRLENKPPGNAILDSNLHDIVTRSWQALENMYKRIYKDTFDIYKLRLGVQWVDTPMMRFKDDTNMVVSKILGITKEEHRIKTQKFIARDLEAVFSPNSKHGRKKSLAMLCNDYAYELRLVNLCIDLIDHFTHIDQTEEEALQTDAFNAMLSLTSTATRNCNEIFTVVLHNFHGLHYIESCLSKRRENLTSFVKQMIDRFERSDNTYEYHLLRAYAYLDESTPDNFKKAIQHEDRVILHTLALVKRLQFLRRSDDALNIIDLAIDHARRNELDSLFYERRWMRRMGFPEAVDFQRNTESNLTLATLIDVKAQVSNGIHIKYEEEPYFDREYQYIPKMYRSQ